MKKLHKLHPIEKKIEHGDFDWPKDVENDYLNQKKALEKRIEAFKEGRKGSNPFDVEMDIVQTFKKSRVTLLKVQEELYQEEEKRLTALKEELEHLHRGKHDKDKLWEDVIEIALKEDAKDTMDFYLIYKEEFTKIKTNQGGVV